MNRMNSTVSDRRLRGLSIGQTLPVWARIGLLSFGGPAGQIALMHKEIVEERNWLTEKQYLNALSFCMMLPGPEAMQLATYCGWRMHGVAGGLVAGLLFVIPGALIVLALAMLYALFGSVPVVEAIFTGVKAAVLIIVLEALLRVARRSLNGVLHWSVALLSFLALFVFNLPFPLVILLAALVGFAVGRDQEGDTGAVTETVSFKATSRTILIWLSVWIVPLVLVAALLDPIHAALGIFFSKLATVTFGGAYAVLAYMSQEAVVGQGWLSAGEMLDGLGLAETTPGPLILVTEFVGFLAAARAEGSLSLGAGLIGAGVTLWATFAPCFLWVFAGAPYIEWLGEKPRLRSALASISAAVVGVILNLSIWFALHVLFADVARRSWGVAHIWVPDIASADAIAIALAIIASALLLLFKRGVLQTLLVCGLLGYAGVTALS